VTEDRLLGGLNFEKTIMSGKRQMTQGLLAQAHSGILYCDELNLLDRFLAQHIASALSTSVVNVEREGLSVKVPADFVFIGTYDPDEGEVSAPLADCVSMHVAPVDYLWPHERAELVSRVATFNRDPVAFAGQYASCSMKLRQLVAQARRRLPQVEIRPEDHRRLALTAMQLGVEGNRADLFALRVARASAALSGRTLILEDDLKVAVQLVLLPRMKENPKHEIRNSKQCFPSARDTGVLDFEIRISDFPGGVEDLLIQATDCHLPDKLLHPPQARSAGRGRGRIHHKKGSHPDAMRHNRGRYVGAVASRPGTGTIALDATLRAAAPLQKCRRQSAARDPAKTAVQVSADDLRWKRFKQKAGMLIIFVVDASGSMALNRMNQVKGAVSRLLQEAYQQRDMVALISFRGDRAEVLLPPSRSLERAKRALDAQPVGGGTPLAAGLHAVLDLARRARWKERRQTMLVLLTDGRANVAGQKPETRNQKPTTNNQKIIWEELQLVCAALREESVVSVVFDSQNRFTSSGQVQAIAELLSGHYFYLPRLDAHAIKTVIEGLRGGEGVRG